MANPNKWIANDEIEVFGEASSKGGREDLPGYGGRPWEFVVDHSLASYANALRGLFSSVILSILGATGRSRERRDDYSHHSFLLHLVLLQFPSISAIDAIH